MAPRESSFANGDRSFALNSQIFGALTPFCCMWSQQSRVDISHRLRFILGMEEMLGSCLVLLGWGQECRGAAGAEEGKGWRD